MKYSKNIVLTMFLSVIILTSCSPKLETISSIGNGQIPKTDFLFEYSGDLSFFNVDGVLIDKIQVVRKCGLIPFCDERIVLKGVTWSRDSQALIGAMWKQGPSMLSPIMILNDGSILTCPNEKRLYEPFRLRLIHDKTILAVEWTENMEDYLVEYNMQTCNIDRRVFEFVNEDSITDVDLSPNNWLAINNGNSVVIYNSDGLKVNTINDASCPAWSKNGDKLVIIKYSRIQIYDEEVNLTKVLPSTNRCPSWSPDGQRIVYSDSNGIKIYDIDSMKVDQIPLNPFYSLDSLEGNLDWNWYK